MYLKLIAIAATTVSLVACMETEGAAGSMAATPLVTEQAFRAAIVGKTVAFDGNTLTVNADGTVSGPWDGSGITGTWFWDGADWCRTIAIGGVERALDCQRWVLKGNVATVTRDRGNGQSFDYTIS